MPTIGSHTFAVIVNGRTLHEYEPPPGEVTGESEKKRVVYIEAVEGAKFEVSSELRGPLSLSTGHLGVHLRLDDIPMNWHPVEKSTYNSHRGDSYAFKNVVYLENQTWVSREFQFSNLTTTDAVPNTADMKKFAQYAGTIRLSMYDMTAPISDATYRQRELPSKTAIPEKALKGQPVDMATEFGTAKLTTERTKQTGQKFVGGCLLDCVFKYRSRKALQMLELLPVTPEPIALHERDPNTLNLAEARELLHQIRTRDRELYVVKQENADIKQEQTSNALLDLARGNYLKRKASSIARNAGGSDDDDDDNDVIFVETKKVKNTSADQIEVLDLS